MEGEVIYSAHVITQMFKRGISEQDIEYILNYGYIIREYPEDSPYPSYLILGVKEGRPLHVVYAVNENGDKIVITTYQPDQAIWNDDFTEKTR